MMSRPARGAWIEICHCESCQLKEWSRPARGAWIEIANAALVEILGSGRAPQGARGLKYEGHARQSLASLSRPARGAWIEMALNYQAKVGYGVAPRKGRVD